MLDAPPRQPSSGESKPTESGAESGRSASSASGFLRIFSVATLALMSLPVGLNFLVNPFAHYPVSIIRPVTWSTRTLRTTALLSCKGTGALIMGSSRSMKLAPAQVKNLTGLRAYNASVDSAMAEDYLALLRLALRGCAGSVREIVLGIDIEAFHDARGPDSRVTGSLAYWNELPAEERVRSALDAAESVLAWDQLAESIRSLRLLLSPGRREEPASRFDDDGFLHYLNWEREKAEGTFKLSASGQIDSYLARFAGYQHLSSRRREIFEQFLGECFAAGIRVRSFVTPLHAEVLAALRARRNFDATRAELLAWLEPLTQANRLFSFVDYSNVLSFGGAEDGFYDGAHIDDENSDRLLKALYAERADALQ